MTALGWIDLLFGAIIMLAAFLGWRRGFLLEFFELATWIASLLLSVRLYQPAAQWLAAATGWPLAWSRPVGFLAIFFLTLMLLRWPIAKILGRLQPKTHQHPLNKVLGILPGMVNGAIYAIVIAALLATTPLPEGIQGRVSESALHHRLAGYAQAIEAKLRPVVDAAIDEALDMRTVRPDSSERVQLPFSVKDAKPRPALEAQMLELVNMERKKAGVQPLVMSAALTAAARRHSADMLARGYFSHYSLEGKTASDRLRAAKIPFLIAGENLAFAPTVKVAHAGLMKSPGHRANILRPQFRKVGIGIMDAGSRGIMVTQKFSN